MSDTLNTPDINGLSMRPTTELVALYQYCMDIVNSRHSSKPWIYTEKARRIQEILDKRLGI